mmetsp:Transcript_14591/g.24888  ORF Transcript_14591/g.24888 Transcript_14591/m.24888 type:complete len:131 (+) Transcript_14591:208-600(+)
MQQMMNEGQQQMVFEGQQDEEDQLANDFNDPNKEIVVQQSNLEEFNLINNCEGEQPQQIIDGPSNLTEENEFDDSQSTPDEYLSNQELIKVVEQNQLMPNVPQLGVLGVGGGPPKKLGGLGIGLNMTKLK